MESTLKYVIELTRGYSNRGIVDRVELEHRRIEWNR